MSGNDSINVTPSTNQWAEDDSKLFLELADIFVPARAEQIELLLHLIPAQPEEAFTIVELASGGGVLAEAILERFPNCRYIALDGSDTMREHMAQRLARFRERLELRAFELSRNDWRQQLPNNVRCVVSMLSIHHLRAAGKRQLFRDMRSKLQPGGALLIADIVEPQTSHIASSMAWQYAEIVKEQSLRSRGDLSGFEEFERQKWNYFAYDYNMPDTYDQPSPLRDQLDWLREVNFQFVDSFWERAGHAIYGAYK